MLPVRCTDQGGKDRSWMSDHGEQGPKSRRPYSRADHRARAHASASRRRPPAAREHAGSTARAEGGRPAAHDGRRAARAHRAPARCRSLRLRQRVHRRADLPPQALRDPGRVARARRADRPAGRHRPDAVLGTAGATRRSRRSSTPASRTSSRSCGTWTARRPTCSTRRSRPGFAALPYPVSLSKLVLELTGAKLGKGLTFTHWDQRPLSPHAAPVRGGRRALPARGPRRARPPAWSRRGHAAWAAEECDAHVRSVAVPLRPGDRSTCACRAPARCSRATWRCSAN